jgi:polygalacturonase
VTEDVAITNCTIHRGHGAVVLGSETSGGIRNVVASNIVRREPTAVFVSRVRAAAAVCWKISASTIG